MGVEELISQNWFDLFSSAGIIGGLWFTAVSLHSETKTRRIANLLTLTANYREVWKEFFHSPELTRVIEPAADVAREPVTPSEEFFVNMVISHTSSVYEALKNELLTEQEGLRRDVRSFFSLPVPKAVWTKAKLPKIVILLHSLNPHWSNDSHGKKGWCHKSSAKRNGSW
jgi:hypothetical protein